MKTVWGSEVLAEYAYTYNDYTVLFAPPKKNEFTAICTKTHLTRHIPLNIPIVGANMGHLGGRMAEKLAQLGGIGILSQDFSLEEILKRIRRVKQANPYFHMPIALHPSDLVAHAQALLSKRHFDCVVVVESDHSPVGLITQKALSKFPGWEQLGNIMKKNPLVVKDTISTEEASHLMISNQINHLPVVNERNQLVGCMTPLDITLRIHDYRPSLDSQGRLLVGVAMGMKGKNAFSPAELAMLYIREGADVLVLDVANGYLAHFVEFAAEMRKAVGPDFPLVAGNVADYEGAMRLFEAGCDTVKVGIGPGGACTTRRETGVGIPQATAIGEAIKAARSVSGPERLILADGGITDFMDLSIATMLGAPSVMIGSLFAGTYESAFETEMIDGEMWKRWRGNASSSAATYRREQIYGERYITEELEHSEGADGLVKVTGSITHKIFHLVEGMKHYMAQNYCGDLFSWKRKQELLRLKFPNFPSKTQIAQLNFEDIYIKPQPSSIESRKQVDLSARLSPGLSLHIPYVALPASFVQKKICTIMAQLGGIGFLSRKRANEDIDKIVQRIKKIKSNHPYYFFPSIQERNEEIGKTIDFLNENNFSCVIIVKNFQHDWTPIGIATREDLYDRPRTDTLQEVIKTNIFKVQEGIDLKEASEIMLNKGIHHLPVIDKQGHLVGCITPRDITLRVVYRLTPNVDGQGKLRVGAAIKTEPFQFDKAMEEGMALEKAGADAILFETDNGYDPHYLEFFRRLREKTNCLLVASGVSTYDGAIALFQAGADVVKAGNPAIHIPAAESIHECSRAALSCGKKIISEDRGNIVYPRDANLSLLLGASAAGLRGVLAPTYENSAQFASTHKKGTEKGTKLVRRVVHGLEYILEDLGPFHHEIAPQFKIEGSVINVIVRFINGLRSSCTYSNAASLEEYQRKAIMGIQTPSGYREGNPHAFLNPDATQIK